MELLQLVLKIQIRRSFVRCDWLPGAIKLYSNYLFRLLNYYSRIVSPNFSPLFIGFLFHLSDADATYSGHKGQGFQAQIMETFSEDKKETVLNLISHVEVEPSHISDAPTLIPAIKSVCPQGHIPVKTRMRKDRLRFISDSLSFYDFIIYGDNFYGA